MRFAYGSFVLKIRVFEGEPEALAAVSGGIRLRNHAANIKKDRSCLTCKDLLGEIV